MKKTKKCNRCGKLVYQNQYTCSKCKDIILFGSTEKAIEAYIYGFKKLGL